MKKIAHDRRKQKRVLKRCVVEFSTDGLTRRGGVPDLHNNERLFHLSFPKQIIAPSDNDDNNVVGSKFIFRTTFFFKFLLSFRYISPTACLCQRLFAVIIRNMWTWTCVPYNTSNSGGKEESV